MAESKNTLSVTARAKDELSGPFENMGKATEAAAKAMDDANQRLVVSEKAKREAMRQARVAQQQARESAQNLTHALSGLRGALEVAAKASGASALEVAQLGAGYKAASLAAGALVDTAKAVVSGIFGTIDASAEFGKRMAEVSTLVDTSKVNVRALSQEVLRLAGEFGKSPVDEARALYQGISAGAFKADEAIGILTTANRLAVAGVTDVFTALDGLTNVVNAYGGSMRNAEPFADAMFVAMRDGKTTIPQLSAAIGNVARTARVAGLTFDETAAAIAAITTGGIATDEAVTALNQALTRLIKPTKETREEAHRLGIEFSTEGVVKAGGFANFLDRIVHSSNLTSVSIGKLFGNIRGIKGVLSLAADDGAKFRSILEDMGNKAGSTAAGLAKMTDDFEHQRERAIALGSALRISFGEYITGSDAVKGALEGLNRAMSIALVGVRKTGTESKTARVEMANLARNGVAAALDAFAGMLELAPDVATFLVVTSILAEKMVHPFVNAAKAVGYIAKTFDDTTNDFKEAAHIEDSPDPLAALRASTAETGGVFANAAKKARELAAAIRENKISAQEVEEADHKAEETRKKDLAEIDRLFKNTQASEAGHEKIKKSRVAQLVAEHGILGDLIPAIVQYDRVNREAGKNADTWTSQADRIAKLKEEYNGLVGSINKIRKANFDDLRRVHEEAVAELEQRRLDQISQASRLLASNLASAFDGALLHAQSFGDAATKILEDLATRAAETGLEKLFSTAFTAIKDASGGGALSQVLSLFGFSRGGLVPQHFATGGIAAGPGGTDQIPAVITGAYGLRPARLSAGEGVIPPDVTAGLRRALAVPSSGAAPSIGGGAGAAPSFVYAPQLAGALPGSAELDRHFRDSWIPAMQRAWSSGQLDFMKR